MNTYAAIGNQTAGWYARKLLSHARPVLILEAFSLSKTLPQNQTKVIEFRRSRQLAPAGELVEGRAPSSQTFAYDAVSIQMRQYGAVVDITDQIQDFSKDRVLPDIVERQGEQIGETRERLLWDVVRSGTNVVYAGRKTARNLLAAPNDVYNVAMQRRIVSVLKQAKANPITKVLSASAKYETYPVQACYVAVCHTHLIPTLNELSGVSSASTNHFIQVASYGSMVPVSIHEEGAFEKVRYVASPDLPAYSGAGANTAAGDNRVDFYTTGSGTFKADVFATVVFGREAFGTVSLRGKRAVQPIIVKPGTPDSGNKLGQVGWAGWKMYFASRILNETWMVRAEHVVKVA